MLGLQCFVADFLKTNTVAVHCCKCTCASPSTLHTPYSDTGRRSPYAEPFRLLFMARLPGEPWVMTGASWLHSPDSSSRPSSTRMGGITHVSDPATSVLDTKLTAPLQNSTAKSDTFVARNVTNIAMLEIHQVMAVLLLTWHRQGWGVLGLCSLGRRDQHYI